MPTLADAIREMMTTLEGPQSRKAIREYVDSNYPGVWRPGALRAVLYASAVNNNLAYRHHPFSQRFLFKNPDETFSLYDELLHGPNVWAAQAETDDDSDETPEELVEASVSLERDLEDHLVQHLDTLEPGLTFVDRQVSNDVGRVDVVARDRDGKTVVIEIKVGEAKDSSIGQIARYLGWYGRNEPVRGILIASGFTEPVTYAAAAIPNLALKRFQIQFRFETVTV